MAIACLWASAAQAVAWAQKPSSPVEPLSEPVAIAAYHSDTAPWREVSADLVVSTRAELEVQAASARVASTRAISAKAESVMQAASTSRAY